MDTQTMDKQTIDTQTMDTQTMDTQINLIVGCYALLFNPAN